MYQEAIRAIPNNFHTLSTLNRGGVGWGGGGAVSIFFKEKGVVPQYFVTDCSSTNCLSN